MRRRRYGWKAVSLRQKYVNRYGKLRGLRLYKKRFSKAIRRRAAAVKIARSERFSKAIRRRAAAAKIARSGWFKRLKKRFEGFRHFPIKRRSSKRRR